MTRAAALVAITMFLAVTPALAQPDQPIPAPAAPPQPDPAAQPDPFAPPQPDPAAQSAPAAEPAQPSLAVAPPGSYYATEPAVQMTQRTRRYGLKIAVADGISTGVTMLGAVVLIASVFEEDDGGAGVSMGAAMMIGGALSLLFTPALIHNSEGNKSGAWKSIGVRLGLPLVGTLIASAVRGDNDGTGPLDSLPGWLFVGGMMADWFIFAKVDVQEPMVMPYAAPTLHGGATMGLRMTF